MRPKAWFVIMIASVASTSLSAHIMVSPPQSKNGSTQKYELRVHNEGKVAATSVELDIPEGVTVIDIEKPQVGTVTTVTTGVRIARLTWAVDVQPSKYVALTFNAKNPETAGAVRWTIREHLADGSVVEWSDNPGAQQKGSTTTLSPS